MEQDSPARPHRTEKRREKKRKSELKEGFLESNDTVVNKKMVCELSSKSEGQGQQKMVKIRRQMEGKENEGVNLVVKESERIEMTTTKKQSKHDDDTEDEEIDTNSMDEGCLTETVLVSSHKSRSQKKAFADNERGHKVQVVKQREGEENNVKGKNVEVGGEVENKGRRGDTDDDKIENRQAHEYVDDSDEETHANLFIRNTPKKKSNTGSFNLSKYPFFVASLNMINDDDHFLLNLAQLILAPSGGELKPENIVPQEQRKLKVLEFSGWGKKFDASAKLRYLCDNKVWTKKEAILDICRVFGLSKVGSREEISERIVSWLKAPSLKRNEVGGSKILTGGTPAEVNELLGKFGLKEGLNLFKKDMLQSKTLRQNNRDCTKAELVAIVERRWKRLESPIKRRYQTCAMTHKDEERKEEEKEKEGGGEEEEGEEEGEKEDKGEQEDVKRKASEKDSGRDLKSSKTTVNKEAMKEGRKKQKVERSNDKSMANGKEAGKKKMIDNDAPAATSMMTTTKSTQRDDKNAVITSASVLQSTQTQVYSTASQNSATQNSASMSADVATETEEESFA